MDYWIATHYPHADPKHPWHIFYRDKPKRWPKQRDRVLFYETEQPEDAGELPGKKRIVLAARVLDPEPTDNIYGNFKEWRYKLDCGEHEPLSIRLALVWPKIVRERFFRKTLTHISEEQYRQILGAGRIAAG